MNSNYINNEKKISETFSNNITSLQQNLSNLEDLKSEINIYLKEYQNHISNEINSNNSIEKSYIDYINGYSTHPIKINYFLKKFNLLKIKIIKE